MTRAERYAVGQATNAGASDGSNWRYWYDLTYSKVK
jgi:hypothetical protein